MQIAFGEMLGVIVITMAYFTLIPLYGIYGAAWSTLAGFIARFYWINMRSKQLYNMELPWAKISLIALTAISIYFLSMLSPEDLIPSILFRSILVVMFISTFFWLPILSKSEKNEIWDKIRRRQSAIDS